MSRNYCARLCEQTWNSISLFASKFFKFRCILPHQKREKKKKKKANSVYYRCTGQQIQKTKGAKGIQLASDTALPTKK